MISCSICLSDIPADKITVGKNGKKYFNFCVDSRREPDQYGQTHTMYVNQSKDERAAKQPKQYIGNGKEFVFDQNQQAQTRPQQQYAAPVSAPLMVNDDMPF